MTIEGLTIAALLIGTWLLDGLVRPRSERNLPIFGRSGAGTWLSTWMALALFGLFVLLCGSWPTACGLALATVAVLQITSNAKNAMLGEPLLFSDLVLVGAIFRHPQFYWSAIPVWLRIAAAFAALGLLGLLAYLFVAALAPHLAGAVIGAASLAILAISLHRPSVRALVPVPDAATDVQRHGLLPTLLLYWLRWRESQDLPSCAQAAREPAPAPAAELVVVVQCESFADPAELFADPDLALPGLRAARAQAWQWGNLNVDGFGAYTMRTEYGVLFGVTEEALGFRRYDPFLTALRDASYALPRRLPDWRSLFLHPHDMRFYGRDKIMPAAGFADLVAEEGFAPPGGGEGRYVTDAAMADTILARAAKASGPSLLYAVTIENHGPWAPEDAHEGGDLLKSYLRLVQKGDAMLEALVDGLSRIGRPALLVFFGDHRPSIPGVTAPGGDRHTPYVMLRLDADGRIVTGDNRQTDLTPAGLHHAVLDTVLGARV